MGMNVNAVGMSPSKAVSYNQAPAFTGKSETEGQADSFNKKSVAKKVAVGAGIIATIATVAAAIAGGKINKAAGNEIDGKLIEKTAKKLGLNIAEGYKAAYETAKAYGNKALEFVKGLGKGKGAVNEATEDLSDKAAV